MCGHIPFAQLSALLRCVSDQLLETGGYLWLPVVTHSGPGQRTSHVAEWDRRAGQDHSSHHQAVGAGHWGTHTHHHPVNADEYVLYSTGWPSLAEISQVAGDALPRWLAQVWRHKALPCDGLIQVHIAPRQLLHQLTGRLRQHLGVGKEGRG